MHEKGDGGCQQHGHGIKGEANYLTMQEASEGVVERQNTH